jgi:uncharacterized protein involved in type VI secretion and phage assembly
MSEGIERELLERLRTRFYGKYRGRVTEVGDKENLGRIKALVPAVLGDQETGWCMPCVPYAGDGVGFVCIPERGAGVWIEFEGGDVSYPIWTGCWWAEDEMPPDAAPDVKVWQTKAGHKIVLSDKDQAITITDSNENEMTLNADGITLRRGSQMVQITDSSVTVNEGALEVT